MTKSDPDRPADPHRLPLSGRSRRGRLVAPFLTLLVAAAACVLDTTDPGIAGDEAFLVIIARTDGPAEISPGQRWSVTLRRLDGSDTDSVFSITPGDTVTLRLPLDSYDVALGGVPIACQDRNGLVRREFLSVPGGTFIMRFNVFCNTFLSMNVATFTATGASEDTAYVYRLIDDAGEVRQSGIVGAQDGVLFDDIEPGSYRLDLGHVDPNCTVVSPGGRSRSFVVDPPRAVVLTYEITCSNPAERPTVVHFESSYREGFSVFYVEAVDPDPDGGGPAFPDIDAYHWSITDCRGETLHSTRVRQGLSRFGSPTRAADTVRLSVAVPLGEPDEALQGMCTGIRLTDLQGNSTPVLEERIGNEIGQPPTDTGSNAVFDAPGGRLQFQVAAHDPDDDFAGSFQRFVFRDGAFGDPDGLPDVLSRNVSGFGANTPVPAFSFTDFPFTVEDLEGIRMILIDRQGNWSRFEDRDLSR